MSGNRFAGHVAIAILAVAVAHAPARQTFCWHVRCLPNNKCTPPPNYLPTVDYPARTIPYSVWYNECFEPHCAGRPSGACK